MTQEQAHHHARVLRALHVHAIPVHDGYNTWSIATDNEVLCQAADAWRMEEALARPDGDPDALRIMDTRKGQRISAPWLLAGIFSVPARATQREGNAP